ncbi:Adenosine 3'-phospho 5'-phosphosulfate transporter 2 [Nymphon striatum]|nr:Adenosine 3'-phospho 5'-phosphosulfate transporter 2 [Nymphon striatum]
MKTSVTVPIDNENKKCLKESQQDNQSIKILFLDLTNFSKSQQFIFCGLGIFICYIPYGYLQEIMFKLDGFKYHGWYLTLYQFFLNAIFAFTERSCKTTNQNRAPSSLLFILASLTVGTIGLSNSSIGYLNYPTQVIFKCCKLIPVMIGGILIQGKKYEIIDFIATFSLSCGLVLFMLADKIVSPNFNITGIVLISGALVADAIIGNLQEKIMKTYGTCNLDLIFYSYGIGFFYILFGCLVSGEFFSAATFFAEYPLLTYGYGFLFSLSGYIGIQVVLTMVLACGALSTVTLTTCRKAITIVLSFLLIQKPFIMQ